MTLVGPNGAGKSTLLTVLLGLQKPTSGTIKRDKNLTIGYVPQFINRDRTLPITVSEFIAFAPKRITSENARQALFKTLRIEHLSQHFLVDISGGELRRVLLARALLNKPQLLVLDEPTAGIDVNGQVSFYDMLAELKAQYQFSVLIVSHDMHLVMSTTNRVICLNKHICCHGVPKQVIASSAYRALFGDGVEQMAVYRHHHQHSHDGFDIPPQ